MEQTGYKPVQSGYALHVFTTPLAQCCPAGLNLSFTFWEDWINNIMFDTLSSYLDYFLYYWGEDGEVYNFINIDKYSEI